MSVKGAYTLTLVTTDADYVTAKQLFREYALSLDIDLQFQHFEEELLSLQQMYGPGDGGILLAREEDRILGCIALRRIDETTGEIKRMYVQPAARGRGIAGLLLTAIIKLAREKGYNFLRLDTLSIMTAAIQSYRSAGFYEIEAYYHNPLGNVCYFEKDLRKG